MDGSTQRAALAALIARDGVSLATLSRVLGRNVAWMQQYLRRGTPRLLPEADRATLARFFGVAEARLGGAAGTVVPVRRYALAASAGPGRAADDERAASAGYPAVELAELGVADDAVSTIEVAGTSMAPTLYDGDRILVDHRQRIPGAADAIWVIRVGDELRVKRLVREGAMVRIVSDAPDWPDERLPAADVEVIGRVVHLRRRL